MTLTSDDPQVLRAEASRQRRAFARSPLSPFVHAMQECLRDYLAARDQGVSRADAVKGLEAVIRAVWPARPSRFPPLCPTCDDVGWQLVRCTHARRCGRWRCSGAEEAWTHTLVVACPCPKGDPYRRSGTRPVERPEDAVEAASHTRRRRGGLSRLAG